MQPVTRQVVQLSSEPAAESESSADPGFNSGGKLTRFTVARFTMTVTNFLCKSRP